MSKVDDTIFMVRNGKPEPTTIRNMEFMRFVDTTTTPRGVAPRLHTRHGNELWTWGPDGNHPHRVHRFDGCCEAIQALEDAWADDFYTHSPGMLEWYPSEQDALDNISMPDDD